MILTYCLRTCHTPWHSARNRVLLTCENLFVRLSPYRNTGGGQWVNEFHPIPPCTKNPRFLNADIRKVQSRGNARAHVFKVRLISPAVVTKMRGAETISAAASSASRCSEKRGSVRFEHAHAKRKFKKKRGRAGGHKLRARASARKLRHSARQQHWTKFMNELSSECSVLSKEPFACDQQIGTNALSSSNEPFACDQHIGTKFMNDLSQSNIRLRAILLPTVYVHVKHRGIARVTVFCYRAKICLLRFTHFCKYRKPIEPHFCTFGIQ